MHAVMHSLKVDVYSESAAYQACLTAKKLNGTLGDGEHWSYKAPWGPAALHETRPYQTVNAYARVGFGLDRNSSPPCTAKPEECLAICQDDCCRAKGVQEDILSRPCPFNCLPWDLIDQAILEVSPKAGYQVTQLLERTFVGPNLPAQSIDHIAMKAQKDAAWHRNKRLLTPHSHAAKILHLR